MKRGMFFALFIAVFLILSYSPLLSSQSDNELYIKDEKVVSGNCPSGYVATLTFKDANDYSFSHCVESGIYDSSSLFVLDSYIIVGAAICQGGYTEYEEFIALQGTQQTKVTFCKKRQTSNIPSILNYSTFSLSNCSDEFFTDGNGRTIWHCKNSSAVDNTVIDDTIGTDLEGKTEATEREIYEIDCDSISCTDLDEDSCLRGDNVYCCDWDLDNEVNETIPKGIGCTSQEENITKTIPACKYKPEPLVKLW
jgi:hypothetical protein